MKKLVIKNLSVNIGEKSILNKFDLEIKSGEIHAIMGPNGIGKSTLLKTIMGDESYSIINGTIEYDSKLLNEMDVDKRAGLGIFLAYQNPVSIEGVSNLDFLQASLSSIRNEKVRISPLMNEINNETNKLKISDEFINRDLNVGFSGGEKKKNEILQLQLLKPSLILLDEIDSGLDIDSLKIVSDSINEYYKENKPAILMVTHYQKLLDYIKPDYVHVLKNGNIVKTGDYSLADKLEQEGYENIE